MRPFVLLVSLVLPVAACAPGDPSTAEIEGALQALVDSIAGEADIPGALLYAYAPSAGLEWAGAGGLSEVETNTPMTRDQTVRNASNTKTYVAAAVLRLWERGQLELDAPVRDYLSDEQVSLLAGDGYGMEVVTLRMLLSHTAGFVDHGSADEYGAAIMANPMRQWTRDDQLSGAVEWGDPLWSAGEAYSYSDTGYILLGQVIERVTGQELGPAVRELLGFADLGLDATWWEIMEPVPESAGARAHQYMGGADTYRWNASLDSWGGGGLITSSRDLGQFWYALFNGRVFEHAATLDTLLTTPLPPDETPYRLGVFVHELDGRTAYEHSGFWGTRVIYVPELDLVVAGAVTEQSRGGAVFGMTNRAVELVTGGARP